jgi:chromosome segregation and condensation protein ScpB
MGCTTGIIITMMMYRRDKGLPRADVQRMLDEVSERLNRIETAVESTALEVERISEGQRFTTKLLAERSGPSAFADKPRAGGSTTPH